MAKRPNDRFYHLRLSKAEGPYLDWTAGGFTEDPFRAWIGNIKALRHEQSVNPLAWVMVKVPSVKRRPVR